jgi:type IV pilus assembly protein PilM
MAAPSRILALNIGARTVGLAEFRTAASGGVILHAYAQTEMPVEGPTDQAKKPQIQAAINELRQQLGLKGGKVNYSISAQSVFTRFVKLPTVSEEKVDQIITFEAQQNVPFPIEEVVWDYQLVGGDDESKIEVVLVAIKSDLLNEANSAVEEGGLQTNLVDVAPMALFNAFRYNYSDLTGCSLLIDVGARTTNLIFVEPKRVFSRSIPIGGATITAAASKELRIPFPAAEERKKREGFVSLGGAYEEPSDPDVARLSKIIRNTMTRLHAEINRSISFYRAQQNGSQPVRAFLCGGCVGLPYMREFFAEKLQMPIEFLNPLRNVSVTSNIEAEDLSKRAHTLGELVGLSLRGIHDCPMELNLRPESVVRAQDIERRKPYLVTAGIIFLLCLAGWWAYFARATEVEQQVLAGVQQKVKQLQGYEDKFRRARKKADALERTAQPYLEAVSDRQHWAAVIQEIHRCLPGEFIWITHFEPTIDGKTVSEARDRPGKDEAGPARMNGVILGGLYLHNLKQERIVDRFADSLKQSPLVAEVVTSKRATPTGNAWAYPYQLDVTLKKPIPLH